MLRRSLPVVCIVLALALPAVAFAAPPSVVDFNGLAPETTVIAQYEASQNIVFGSPSQWIQGFPTYSGCGSEAGDAPTVSDIAGARGGEIGCSRDEISALYETAIHTDIERRGVSFNLRGNKLVDNEVIVSFYNAGTVGGPPSVIATQTLSVSGNAVVPVSLLRPGTTQDIVTVVIRAVGETFSTLLLDDISMLKDDVPPPPKFSFSLGRPTTDVVEGASVDAPVNLQRYNGSAGAVTFSVGAPLPAGIDAAQVLPNPVSGTNPPALRVAAALPFSGDRQVSVGASGTAGAGTFIGGGRVQTVRGIPAILAGDGGVARPGAQTTVVPACGDKLAEYPVTVRGGFSGFVDMFVDRLDGPVTLGETFIRRIAAGNGTLAFQYVLRQALGVRGGSTLRLRFRPQNGTPVDATVRVFEDTFSIDSVGGAYSPFGISADELLPGYRFSSSRSNELTLKGSFPTGCNPNFLDDAGRAVSEISHTEDPAGGLDTYRLKLPSPPTTTAIRAMGPGSVELARSKTLPVFGYRNTGAVSAGNSGANAGSTTFSWSDFVHAFGSDDAEQCSAFECHRDPFSLQAFDNIRDKLRAGGGLCFGYATQSILFTKGDDIPSLYSPPGPITGWELPFFEGSKIKDEVVRWQISQYDGDWSDYTSDLKDDVPTFAQFRDHIRDALINRDQVIVAVRSGSSGHAVVAYDLREQPNGTLDILTYNPNSPYTTAEQTSAAARNDAATRSTIFVTPGGQWRGGIFPGGTVNTPWTGGLSSIEIYDRGLPNGIDLPFGFFTMSLDSAPGTAEVSSVKANGTEALRADGTSIAGTGVGDLVRPSGPANAIDYRLARGRSYDVTVTGKRDGVIGSSVLGGQSGADVDGLRTKKGQKDRITYTPGVAGLTLSPGGAASAATIKLLARAGKGVTQMADVSLAARGGAKEQATLAGGAVDLKHSGPATTISVKIGSTGLGAPGSVSTSAIRLGPGDRLTLRPRSWSDLGAGVALTIRDAKGRVTRRGLASLRATTAVGLRSVGARVKRAGKSRQVIVTGRVTKTGRAPLLVATVKVLRGGRVLSSAGASLRGGKVKRGAFRLPVILKSLPPGATVRVTISLADEAAGFASVRRVLRAR